MNKQFKTLTLIKYLSNAEKLQSRNVSCHKNKRQRVLKTFSFFLRTILCLDCNVQHIDSGTQFLLFWPY